MTTIGDKVRILKEVVATYLEELSRHLTRAVEENHVRSVESGGL